MNESILRQAVNAPEYFRRDTPLLFKALDRVESFTQQFKKEIAELDDGRDRRVHLAAIGNR